ncbi:MAG TPA: TonB family protein [Kofleriaceae bacterium]|nr:TonB family protein [Kofleriaceae bacterium]
MIAWPTWLDPKLVVCGLGSVAAHFALARGLDQLPPYVVPRPPHKIAIQVIEPEKEPPKEPAKPPEPEPAPKPVAHELPKARPVHAPMVAAVPKEAPPPDHPAVQTDSTDPPVFGVSMESTSTVGGGPAMPVGNTTAPVQAGSAAPVKPVAQPIAAFEATKMPLPQGRCFGKYTDEAHAAGTEGVVVLDLTVGEDGRTRDIQVVQGLPHGLTEAAVAALRDCHFSPGEKDGRPVPVRVRGFKIRFVLDEPQ